LNLCDQNWNDEFWNDLFNGTLTRERITDCELAEKVAGADIYSRLANIVVGFVVQLMIFKTITKKMGMMVLSISEIGKTKQCKQRMLLAFITFCFYTQILAGFFVIFMNQLFMTASANLFDSLNKAFAIIVLNDIDDLMSLIYTLYVETYWNEEVH